MAQFTIDRFRSEVLSRGLAKPNRFEVVISAPPCVNQPQTAQLVSLFAESAQLPITRINTSQQRIFGPPTQHPQYAEYGGDNISVQFYLDREMSIKKFFDTWIDGVVNRKTFTAYYQKNYLTTASISQLDEQDNVMYRAKFEDLFPISVNPYVVDHNQPNTAGRLNVTFAYRIWRYEEAGTPQAPKNNVTDPVRPKPRTQPDQPRIDFIGQSSPMGGTQDNPMSFASNSGFGA